MACKYGLERPYAGDCAGCPASYWIDNGIGCKEGYYRSGRFSCKIEDGLMSIEEVQRIDEEYDDDLI